METVRPPQSEYDDGEPSESQGRWFQSDVFAEVLRRCEAHDIAVTIMLHDSPDPGADRREFDLPKKPIQPFEVLKHWQSEGCDGRFFAEFKVPDSLVL